MAAAEMLSEPRVSCIVIFWNAESFLDEAVRSVVGQRGIDDWEIVLVDDGSTDTSTTVARQWAARDHRIRYVDHPDHGNLGMSASRNRGVVEARGRYVVFLDSDDVVLPTAFADRAPVLDADPTIDAVLSPVWLWHTWTGRLRDRRRDDLMPVPPGLPIGEKVPPTAVFRAAYGTPGRWTTVAMCGVMVRRTSLQRIGGFDAAFRGMFEDQVFYAKLFLRAIVVVDPRPMSRYRQHSGSACAAAERTGDYDPAAPNAALDRFLEWLASYASETFGAHSEEAAIADANRASRGFAPDWAQRGSTRHRWLSRIARWRSS